MALFGKQKCLILETQLEITFMEAKFTLVVAGKSKPKMIAPKTQKSRQNAEIPVMVSNQPDSVILDTVWGGRWDSNPQPLGPQPSAPPLSYDHHILLHYYFMVMHQMMAVIT